MTTLLVLVAIGLGAAEPSPRATYAPSWPRVLEGFVDGEGRVDFEGLRREPQDLAEQVDFVARTDYDALPDEKTQIAFLINAYNSLAMSHAAHSGKLPRNKVRFFMLSGHIVGGRKLSLSVLENKVIRPMGEPRVHFALNCMVKDCPRLPAEAFMPERLDAQLEAASRGFLNDPRHVQVDDASRTARLSSILKWYKGDFLAQAPSLIAYVNRFRDRKIPEGFKAEFLDYDWTLNDSGRTPSR